ncbi:MAG: TonB-dependent receptor [Prolixibacteraceae bacterium]|jgi:TonB-linked SusC/RagA family outer membrane protein|nr:TonB-dependent receptor [Prolixibacteraceae bacterium]
MNINLFNKKLWLSLAFFLAFVTIATAQKIDISGVVLDRETNEAIPGVNVLIMGEFSGTVTDIDGQFKLNTEIGKTLKFSFLGYNSAEIKIENASPIKVALSPDVQQIDDVVVVGYGIMKKSDLTGSVSSVKSESFKEMAKTGLDQALQGRAAGVMVTNNTGAPGSGVSIRIRGVGSIARSNEPLYIIDGVPIDNAQVSNKQTGSDQINTLSGLNPDDIERFEILKDPASCAIYGARGANGVVLITTKRGSKGANQFEFSSYYGVSQVVKQLDLLNSSQYQRLVYEGLKRMRVPDGDFRYITDEEVAMYNTNWQDEIFRTAPTYNVNLSARGGSDKATYFISGGYYKSDGIVINTGIERFSATSNVDINMTDKLKVGLNLTASHTTGLRQNNSGMEAGIDQNKATGAPIIASALSSSPVYPVYDSIGRYGVDLRNRSVANPVMLANEQALNYSTNRILASAYIDYEIIKGLTFKNIFGSDLRNTKESFFWGPYYFPDDGLLMPASGRASDNYNNGLSWVFTSTLNYMFNVGKNSFTILLGHEASRMQTTGTYVEVGGMPVDYIKTFDSSPSNTISSNFYTANTLESYFGRVNYSYDDRYLFQINIRRDGSSRFGPENKWGTFPAFSFGWNAAKESFMENQRIINELKPRLSYGITGNQNIGDYSWRGSFEVGTIPGSDADGTVMNYLDHLGGKYTSISDYGFSWEESRTTNIGFDMGMFDNRLYFSLDAYERVTDNLILNVQLPITTGVYSATNNAGKLTNTGYEFAITSRNIVGKFNWTTDFNISSSKLHVDRLVTDSIQVGNNILIMGQDLQIFTYIREENVDSMRGNVVLRDLNDDGSVTYGGGTADRTTVGSPLPKFFGGMSNTFSYKGFELSVFLQYMYGNKIYNSTRQALETLHIAPGQGLIVNSTVESFENRWISSDVIDDEGNVIWAQNRHTPYPATNFAGNNIDQREGHNGFVEDGSYLRLKNISFGYSIPRKYLTKVNLASAKLYVSGTNLWTLTNYSGFDPEVNSVSGSGIESNLGIGRDSGSYPQARTITMGINISF